MHCRTLFASVASLLMPGAHWQPLSAMVQPSQLLFLRHFTPPSQEVVDFLLFVLSSSYIDDVLYLRDVTKCVALINCQLSEKPDQPWVKETMLLQPSEPCLSNLNGLLWHLSKNPEDASHLLYHLFLRTLRQTPVSSPKCVRKSYTKLRPYLLLFAEECSFSITSDALLHCVVYCHLPAEIGMADGTPFQHITGIMGDCANKFIRPYIDTSVADQMHLREDEEDDVVLFCLMVTLIVEIEKKKTLKLCYNRDVLKALDFSSVPTPFVLVDLDWGLGKNDYFGYTYKGSLVVCNGLGCAQAISQWISVCEELSYCREVADDDVTPDNPLFKFKSAI